MRLKILKARGKNVDLLGKYYMVDTEGGTVVQTHVDPEKLWRELGCLKPWEEMVPK